MSDLPTAPEDVRATLGALEIGVFIALFLFGIATAQSFVYFQRFPKDPLFMKSLVKFLCTCPFPALIVFLVE